MESSSENRLRYPNKRESFSQRNNDYIDNRYRGVMTMQNNHKIKTSFTRGKIGLE